MEKESKAETIVSGISSPKPKDATPTKRPPPNAPDKGFTEAFSPVTGSVVVEVNVEDTAQPERNWLSRELRKIADDIANRGQSGEYVLHATPARRNNRV